MCRGSRVDYKTLDIGYIGKKREYLQAVNKFPCLFLSAFNIKGKDGTAAVREIPFIKRMVRVIFEGGMVYPFDLRMMSKEFHDFLCIFGMSLKPERQGFHTLQEQECIKRGNGSARVTKQDRTDIGHKCSRSHCVIEGDAVIAWIRGGDIRILSRSGPVEFPGFHHNAAEGCPVTADELRGGMNHDIRSVFDRADEVRRSEGIIDHNRNSVPVGDFRNRVDIRDIAVRIAKRFQEDRPCVIRNRCFHFFRIMDIDKCRADAVLGKRMLQQIKCAAVDRFLRYDMAAICRKGLYSI